ncbi:MAG: DegV family protein [Thomasclavelia sp.]
MIQAAVHKIKETGYDHIIALSIATGLSSTLNGMKLACDMVGMPVTLIDTKGTASNHRYLIRVAKKLIDDKSINDIESILTAMIEQSGTLIMAPNLDHLKKGGRITPAVAMLGNLLKIVPVMKLNYESWW